RGHAGAPVRGVLRKKRAKPRRLARRTSPRRVPERDPRANPQRRLDRHRRERARVLGDDRATRERRRHPRVAVRAHLALRRHGSERTRPRELLPRAEEPHPGALTWPGIVERVLFMPYRAPWELEDRTESDVSSESFDRVAFAERALALLRPPPGTT